MANNNGSELSPAQEVERSVKYVRSGLMNAIDFLNQEGRAYLTPPLLAALTALAAFSDQSLKEWLDEEARKIR